MNLESDNITGTLAQRFAAMRTLLMSGGLDMLELIVAWVNISGEQDRSACIEAILGSGSQEVLNLLTTQIVDWVIVATDDKERSLRIQMVLNSNHSALITALQPVINAGGAGEGGTRATRETSVLITDTAAGRPADKNASEAPASPKK